MEYKSLRITIHTTIFMLAYVRHCGLFVFLLNVYLCIVKEARLRPSMYMYICQMLERI